MDAMIIARLEKAGFTPKKSGSTNGGEYSSPCPWCGGVDRFRVWPAEGETGGYWCRQCQKHGDGISLVRELDGLTFSEACEVMHITMPSKYDHEKRPLFIPAKVEPPDDPWQQWAKEIIGEAEQAIYRPEGIEAIIHLIGRGIYVDDGKCLQNTAKKNCLGWVAPHTDGLPSGLLIPTFGIDDKVLRLRVRRLDGGRPPYQLAKGSKTAPMMLGRGPIAIIVESELDAILLDQDLPGGVLIVGLGSAQQRPTERLHERLLRCRLIAVALDNDDAGEKAWRWWEKRYRTARRLSPVGGKDPGDMRIKNLSLDRWFNDLLYEVGLLLQHENYLERAAIMEFDGGLSREVAEASAMAIAWGGMSIKRK